MLFPFLKIFFEFCLSKQKKKEKLDFEDTVFCKICCGHINDMDEIILITSVALLCEKKNCSLIGSSARSESF